MTKIRDDAVILRYKKSCNCDIDEYEDVTIGSLNEGGTPICPECGDDFEFVATYLEDNYRINEE